MNRIITEMYVKLQLGKMDGKPHGTIRADKRVLELVGKVREDVEEEFSELRFTG